MNKTTLADRLRTFRAERGLSQQELAYELGVGKITVLRWENSTSKPSPLAAEKLQQIGFGSIEPRDTKQSSIPRSILRVQERDKLREDIRQSIQIGNNSYYFNPTSYIINGPEDQLRFFETLFSLQEISELPCSLSEYCRRLSLIADIPELKVSSAQYELEHPKIDAKHWNPNYGPHGWHRYVGRFPPHLIRSLLNHFGAKKGEIVCDPFAGSGTTLVESRLLGLKAVGIEICPLSCLISRIKSKFPQSTSQLTALAESLTAFYRERWRAFVGDRDVASIPYERILQRNGNSIDAFPNCEKWLIPEALLGTSLVVEFAHTLNGYEQDAVCCALSSRMRSIGNVDVDVVRAEYRVTPRARVDVLNHVRNAIHRMILDIRETVVTHESLLSSPDDIQVIEGSILDTEVEPSSIDYIITSPPYGVESISYLRTHLLSYRCLQPILQYNPYTFDNKIIGSEYVRENGMLISKSLAATHSQTFTRFFHNELSAQLTNKVVHRKQMMMHFFDEMVEVGQRFSEWLRPKGRLAFVIGNKKIGDYVIPTDRIISEIFNACGMDLDETIRHKLKCNNSNSEVPWQERTIQDEHVMIFTKRT